MKKFEPRLCSFSTLFKRKRLIIPSDFQRSYRWNKNFWKSWLKDVVELVKLNQVNEIHFVGGVAIKQKSEQKQTDLYIDYQIIDGQQRITTVFILLLAILNSRFLDKARTKDAETIFHIRELLFLEKKRDEEERSKVRLLTASQIEEEEDEEKEDVLTKIVEKIPDLETLKGNKIWEAYKFFVGKIEKEKLARDLDLIVEKIKENLMFILIETDAQEDGRKVFEIINHSKLDLTQADEIKLFLATRCKEESFSERKWIKKWDTLIKNVGEENLDHLFFVFLNKHEEKGGRYSGSEFVDYFKKWTKNQSIELLLDEIVQTSNIYGEILNPSHDFWRDEDFYQRIVELNILGKRTRSLYSFVILLKEYGKDDTKMKLAASVLEKIILFIFRGRFWSDKGASWHEIDRWNKKVRENQLDTILQDPNIVKEIDNVGFWDALEKETNASKEKNRYLLARYYFTLIPKSTFPNLKNLQIEHIFPKNPAKEWLNIPQWKYLEPKQIKEKYLNSIGNLTLLSSQKNIDCRNHTWDIKAKEVREGTFLKLENNKELDLFNEKEFLPEYIDKRRKWLITQFKDKGILFIDGDKEKKILEELEESNK